MLVSLNATPQVSADFTTLTSVEGCGTLVVEFQDLSLGDPVAWLWDFGNGNTSNVRNPIAVYNTPGEFDVELKISDGIHDDVISISSYVVVYNKPNPLIHYISGTDGCLPLNTSFQDISNSPIVSWQWDFGDGGSSNVENPDYVYLSQGLYSVSLSVVDTNGCENLVSEFDLIQVNNAPRADFSADILFSCDSVELVSFINNSTFSSEFMWDFGNGFESSLLEPTHIFNSGLHSVTLLAKEDNCIDTLVISDMINIIGAKNPEFTVDTSSGCEGLNVSFSSISNNLSHDFYWDFGDGHNSILPNPNHTFNSPGIYDISLTISHSGQCTLTNTSFSEIEVFSNPVILIDADTTLGCNIPFNVSFVSDIINGVQWTWDFGDGNYSYLQNPTHSYINSGEYNVSLIVENTHGCIAFDTLKNFISLYEAPIIDFHASPLVSCVGVDINFFDLSSNILNNWLWNFGNGFVDSIKNPTYKYFSSGTFDVSLVGGVGSCVDTIVFPNYINIVEPTAIFEETYSCINPLTVEFYNFSLGSDSIFWDFGDGVTSNLQNPVHTFSNLGIHIVTLSIYNNITGCNHSITKQIMLTKPIAQFDYFINAQNTLSDSAGCIPKKVHLENQSQDWSHYRVYWSDGHIGYGRIDHIFTDTGTFDVTMVVVDVHGCKDTATIENMFHMYDVNLDFVVSNISSCDSMLVEFEDLSEHPFESVLWEFGDGGNSALNNPQYIYNTQGVYDIALYTKSIYGCKDTLMKYNYITFTKPKADFSVNNNSICIEDTVSFINSSLGNGMDYIWDFGDGNFSSELNPEHVFFSNGLYNISLTVTDSFGCSNILSFDDYVNVLSPNADFSISPLQSNCPPVIADFVNLSSTDAILYEWRFGDGSISLVENPTHLFANSGLFDVSLTVKNSFGCTDTLVQNSFVDLSGLTPMGSFIVSDTIVCLNDDVSFYPNVINVETFLWDFGDGNTSVDSFPNIVYNDTGIYIPTLIVENNTGCKLTIYNSDAIWVNQVTVDAGLNIEICEGEFVEIDASGNGSSFNWFPSTSLSLADISNPIANPNTDIMYYVHSTNGFCNAIDSLFITVYNDVPQPDFYTIGHCEGDSTSFVADAGINTVNNAYVWSFGEFGQTTIIPLNVGNHTISLIVENLDNSCKDSIIQDVTIFPKPFADFLFSSSESCLGDSIIFTDNTSNNTVAWAYNFGDSLGDVTDSISVYTYLDPGIFSVVLNVISDMGCIDSISKDIIIHDLPHVDFLVENNCEDIGNVFIDVSFINDGRIAASKYNFNDGHTSIDSIAHHVFDGYGLFDVSLEVFSVDGCSNSFSKTVEVYANPIINFSCSKFCEGDLTIFNNFSFVDYSEILIYNWTFESDSFSLEKNPEYTFSSSGLYDVSLSALSSNGCTNTLVKQLEIYRLPSPLFDIAADICLQESATISYVLDVKFPEVIEWNYNFGDGYHSQESNPTYFYTSSGSYDIGLEVVSSDGCMNDTIFYDIVEVHPLPFADFHVSSFSESELNSKISFFNNSKGAEFFEWNFNDGNYSFEENPSHRFDLPQIYSVSMNAISQFGCISTAYENIKINPEYTFFVPDAFSPNGDGLNDVFLAKGDRFLSYEMQIFDRWGGLLFESTDINVGWHGVNSQGINVNESIYFYHISVYDINNRHWIYNGEVRLMR